MSIFEYDEEKVKRLLRKDAYEDGQAKGIIETSLEHGASEQKILERLQNKLGISPQMYNVDVGERGRLLTALSDSADICLEMQNRITAAMKAFHPLLLPRLAGAAGGRGFRGDPGGCPRAVREDGKRDVERAPTGIHVF